MKPKKSSYSVDVIVFLGCCQIALLWGAFALGRYVEAKEPKKCATVSGQQVVSTTADTCTYANSFVRVTVKRKAL